MPYEVTLAGLELNYVDHTDLNSEICLALPPQYWVSRYESSHWPGPKFIKNTKFDFFHWVTCFVWNIFICYQCTTLEQKLKTLTEELSCQRQNAESAKYSLEQKIKEKEKELQEVRWMGSWRNFSQKDLLTLRFGRTISYDWGHYGVGMLCEPKVAAFPSYLHFRTFSIIFFLLARALSGVGFLYGLEIWYCCGKGVSLLSWSMVRWWLCSSFAFLSYELVTYLTQYLRQSGNQRWAGRYFPSMGCSGASIWA